MVRFRPRGSTDLGGRSAASIPVVVDANVFIALHGYTPDHEIVKCLSALEDRPELRVTPELNNEINRLEDPSERERLLHITQQYPRLNVDPHDLADTLQCVGGKLSRLQDLSDIRHLAYARSAGIDVLVTADQKVMRVLVIAPASLGGTVTVLSAVLGHSDSVVSVSRHHDH